MDRVHGKPSPLLPEGGWGKAALGPLCLPGLFHAFQESRRPLLGLGTWVGRQGQGRREWRVVGKVQVAGSLGKEAQPQQGPWSEGTRWPGHASFPGPDCRVPMENDLHGGADLTNPDPRLCL